MAEAVAIDDEAGRDEARARRLRWRMLIGFLAGLVIGLSVHYGAPGAAWVETVTAYVTGPLGRSEEHTSELQSLMRTSSAVFCLQKKTTKHKQITYDRTSK